MKKFFKKAVGTLLSWVFVLGVMYVFFLAYRWFNWTFGYREKVMEITQPLACKIVTLEDTILRLEKKLNELSKEKEDGKGNNDQSE